MNKKFILIDVLANIPDIFLNSFLTVYLLGKGCSYSQIGILWSAYLGCCAIIDYPTGGLADKFGRRKIYAIGILLTSVSYFILFFSVSFPLLFFSYLLKGVGTSQMTGALQSWLACDSGEIVYEKSIKRARLIMSVLNVVIPIMCILINVSNIDIIVLFSCIFFFILSIFVMILLKENYGSTKKLSHIYKSSILIFLKNSVMLELLLFNIFSYTLYTSFLFLWQPIAESIVIQLNFLPVMFGIFSFSSGLGTNFLGKIIKKADTQYLFIIFIFLASFFSFWLAHVNSNLSFLILAMIFFGFGNGSIFILNAVKFNQVATQEYKASLFSLVSSITTGITFGVQILFGYILDYMGRKTLIILNILLCICIFVFKVIKIKLKKNNQ